MRTKIGSFSAEVIDLLKLDIEVGTPIYIADSNIQHMQTSHPADYQKYGSDISDIIAHPDYVGINEKDNSVEFTKEYLINGAQKGTLKPLDKHPK